jgi:hypothetical protein
LCHTERTLRCVLKTEVDTFVADLARNHRQCTLPPLRGL